MHLPPIDKAEVERWRARWGGRQVVLFAGQIRRDKRLDFLIEAGAAWHSDARLAVVGRDAGDAARCRSLAERLGLPVDWTQEYVPLGTFLAALAAADVVVCPYVRGSSSGVLATAMQVGTPTIATDVGGIGEFASDTIPPDADAAALARTVDAVLQRGRRGTPATQEREAIAAHRRAYGLGRDQSIGSQNPCGDGG
jgi:glycosyltransferase involved in cell wall biosynthesis